MEHPNNNNNTQPADAVIHLDHPGDQQPQVIIMSLEEFLRAAKCVKHKGRGSRNDPIIID